MPLSERSKSLLITSIIAIVAIGLGITLINSLSQTSSDDSDTVTEGGLLSTMQVAAEKEELSTFVQLLGYAGMTNELSGTGPFTIFAPTNEALASLPEDVYNALFNDPAYAREVLGYHIVPGDVTINDALKLQQLPTLISSEVRVETRGEQVYVGDAQITQSELEGTNGRVHLLNGVNLP